MCGLFDESEIELCSRKSFDEDKYLEVCRLDLVWWIKTEWGELVSSVGDISKNLGLIEIPIKIKRRTSNWVWSYPPGGNHIKVNVGGSFLGDSGRGGIRGIFKDLESKILI